MGNPLRDKNPEIYRLITIRTTEARLWITPSAKVRKLIGGIVARYQEALGIEIYAYCFLGNHPHLLIKAPRANADEFCENMNREIARRLNWKHHREGQFWGRRYSEQEVIADPSDLLEAFLYINTNPSKHGLVRDSSTWPGLSSYNQSLDGEDRRFSFHHYSAVDEAARVTVHKLKLSVLPQFASLSRKRRKAAIEGLLKERMEQIAKERKEKGQGFLGLEGVLGTFPGSIPQTVSRAPRPPCYTKCPERRREFKRRNRERRARYSEASFHYRLGNLNVEFPEHTFKPPLHRAPRIIPLHPLSHDFLKPAA